MAYFRHVSCTKLALGLFLCSPVGAQSIENAQTQGYCAPILKDIHGNVEINCNAPSDETNSVLGLIRRIDQNLTKEWIEQEFGSPEKADGDAWVSYSYRNVQLGIAYCGSGVVHSYSLSDSGSLTSERAVAIPLNGKGYTAFPETTIFEYMKLYVREFGHKCELFSNVGNAGGKIELNCSASGQGRASSARIPVGVPRDIWFTNSFDFRPGGEPPSDKVLDAIGGGTVVELDYDLERSKAVINDLNGYSMLDFLKLVGSVPAKKISFHSLGCS